MSRYTANTKETPQQMKSPTGSPCVRICTLDDEDVCIGCGRTLEEIKAWNGYSPGERAKHLSASKRRQEKRQSLF